MKTITSRLPQKALGKTQNRHGSFLHQTDLSATPGEPGRCQALRNHIV